MQKIHVKKNKLAFLLSCQVLREIRISYLKDLKKFRGMFSCLITEHSFSILIFIKCKKCWTKKEKIEKEILLN